MALEQDQTTEKLPALAGDFLAARGELYEAELDPQEADISQTLQGSKAITGRAVWSANNALRQNDSGANERAHDASTQKHVEELMRMAAWDAQKVYVGGVEMTNAEARLAVINDGDKYAQWAVDHGYLAEGEKDEFKDAARRMYELKESERLHGSMTAAEKQEWEGLQESRAGRAVDAATAQAHKDFSHENRLTAANMATERGDVFPTAPDMNTAFVAASAPAQATSATPNNAPTPQPQKPQASTPAF